MLEFLSKKATVKNQLQKKNINGSLQGTQQWAEPSPLAGAHPLQPVFPPQNLMKTKEFDTIDDKFHGSAKKSYSVCSGFFVVVKTSFISTVFIINLKTLQRFSKNKKTSKNSLLQCHPEVQTGSP